MFKEEARKAAPRHAGQAGQFVHVDPLPDVCAYETDDSRHADFTAEYGLGGKPAEDATRLQHDLRLPGAPLKAGVENTRGFVTEPPAGRINVGTTVVAGNKWFALDSGELLGEAERPGRYAAMGMWACSGGAYTRQQFLNALNEGVKPPSRGESRRSNMVTWAVRRLTTCA